MEITCDTSVESNFDLDEMIARLEAVDGREAEAGIFGGFAAKKAMWNEYGTSRCIKENFHCCSIFWIHPLRCYEQCHPQIQILLHRLKYLHYL